MKKFVAIKFKETPFKSYHFLTDLEDLKVGDLVVVDTRNGFQLAEVEKYVTSKKLDSLDINGKWVVQKIDMEQHFARVAKEKKMAELKAKMDSRRQQIQEYQLLVLMAKEDAGMKVLLDEYTELLNQ